MTVTDTTPAAAPAPLPNIRELGAHLAVLTAVKSSIDDQITLQKQAVEDALSRLREAGVDTKTVELAVDSLGLGRVGSITVPTSTDRVEVDDQAAWLAYVEANHPTEVVYADPTVNSAWSAAFIKGLLADYVSGALINPATGEWIPGLAAVKGGVPMTARVTVGKADKARIMQVLTLDTLGQLALNGGPDEPYVVDSIVVPPAPQAA